MVSMTAPATPMKRIVDSRQHSRRVVRTSSSALVQHHLLVFFQDNLSRVCRDLGIAMDMWTVRMDRMSPQRVDLRHVVLAISSVPTTSVFLTFGNVTEM